MEAGGLRDTTGGDPGVAFRADPALPGVQDPHPIYAALREQAAAHWCDGPQMWAILAYPQARQAMREPTLVRQPERDRLAQLYGQSDIYERQKLDLPYMDGEAHRVMRRHVINAYRAIDITELTTYIRHFADERLASVAGQDSFDLIALLAADLPVYVVSHLLGVPPQDFASAAAVVRPFVAARGLVQNRTIAASGDEAVRVFEEFFLPLIHARRAVPTGDLTSRLVADPIDGMSMSDEQMLLLVSSNFYAASLFTIRLLIGTMAVAMARHPDVYQALRRDHSLIPAAVEEVLRWDAPAQAVNSSIAAEDFACGDVTIPAGDAVTVLVGAANRDPQQFPDPDTVRLDRAPNRHLSFAPGIHQCLGLNLARLQGSIALAAMAEHLPEFGYDPETSVRLVGDRFRGYDTLIIRR
ncbi:MAG: cytochrome P450 [Mycobacterium sp.]